MWSNFLFFALMIWFVLVQTKAQDLAHLQNVKSQYLVELANEVNNQSLFFSFKEKINSFVTNNKFTDEDLLDEIKKLNEGLENFTSVIDKVDTDSLLVLFFPLYLYSNNLMITSLTRDLLSGSGQKLSLIHI
ncbi:MAG: hypothetical protein IAE91_00265, partial [Ignavibacteriaceae bacterium]|nr:hypothetical protein [Ignavibacteriaceae bacterium]